MSAVAKRARNADPDTFDDSDDDSGRPRVVPRLEIELPRRDPSDANAGLDDDRTQCSAAAAETAICMDAEKTHVFISCMHKAICAACADRLLDADPWRGTVYQDAVQCPICRVKSLEIKKVFE